jgi:DNA-binding transcriptional ArsR family regulator
MAIDYQALALAETHPLRIDILKLLDASSEPMSPKMLSGETGQPLGNVSYHVGGLRDAGLIVLHSTRARRGAVEHLYALAGGGS